MSWKRLIDEDLARELRQRPSPFDKNSPRKPITELWPDKSEREAWAAKWLAMKLDDTTKRDDRKAECMTKWKITERAFEERIWPAARKHRGLSPHSPPGPKRKPKSNSPH